MIPLESATDELPGWPCLTLLGYVKWDGRSSSAILAEASEVDLVQFRGGDAVRIRAALLQSRFNRLLDIALEFGLEEVLTQRRKEAKAQRNLVNDQNKGLN